ncbi:peptide/nickel transport system ATP-binding protein [Friedmanniella endophytica]|uniref:Peptide/nickel transport system ATP-binding protein n=1 Tax=Microlunatus kandeliicorticis TaxID=1759536 RepID=A0A7W3IQT0_9ACTN|nr:ABC transporter ATP-binding protein [Microlunatus kandeliicorticis]MBA8793549.1 peptide/nickel transport system ATP-binding protein [Microlunatus kandeliicorticis]
MSTATAPSAGDTATPPEGALLAATDLTRTFRVGGWRGRKTLHAVDEATFAIGKGEIVALVGESGSGKSTIARLLAGVYRPSSGDIWFNGRRVSALRSRGEQLAYRAAVPMVFQDPFSSLNPAYRVNHGILRGLKLHRPDIAPADRMDEAIRVVEAVGLRPAAEVLQRYPYELSGGQRQRIGFAQALAYQPQVILADEPVSMLDISIRIGLLNVMARLRDEQGVSLLYITHDIASARYVADRMMVMYAGRVVESGPVEEVLGNPRHPYTQLLVAAVPDPRAALTVTAEQAKGEPPKVIDPEPGCRFADRCPLVRDVCRRVTPPLLELAPGDGAPVLAACHVAAEQAGRGAESAHAA